MDLDRFKVKGRRILGPVGVGVSGSIYIEAEDGLVYVSKARILNPSEWYTPANEFLSALLADYFSLPIPRFKIVECVGENFFGSEKQKTLPFDPAGEPLPVRRVLADVFCFDVWVMNTDRHLGNFVYVDSGPGAVQRPALKVIDHGRALWGPAPTFDSTILQEKNVRTDISDFLRADVYRPYVQSFGDFQPMLRKIEALPRRELEEMIDINLYLRSEEKQQILETLLGRRQILEELLYKNRALFGLP